MYYILTNIFSSSESNVNMYSFCNLEDEEKIHLFANCCKSKTLWNSLRQFFKDTIDMPLLISQSAIFGIVQIDREFF